MSKIASLSTEETIKILGVADMIISYVIQEKEGRGAGVLCVADQNGSLFFSKTFGIFDTKEEKRDHTFFSQEQAERLSRHSGHATSGESRRVDTSPPQYDGAIWAGNLILSLSSSLGEEKDVAIMIELALVMGKIDAKKAGEIVKINRNHYFLSLQQALASVAVC